MKKSNVILVNSILLVSYLSVGVLANVFKDSLNDSLGRINKGKVIEEAPSDLNYDKIEFSSEEELDQYEENLVRDIADEGYVLLKNDNNNEKGLPLSKNSKISLFSYSSIDLLTGGTGSGTGKVDDNLKDALTSQGFKVNETLWDFYSKGNGKKYIRGEGSIYYGSSEDWSINECPLSIMQKESGLLASAYNTTPIFVLSRTCGEGRDLARNMSNHTDISIDKNKHYLELDSIEKEILNYLNVNYDNIILVVNSNNAFELGFLDDYKNIRSVLLSQGGGGKTATAIADILSGKVNPSGHLVDTFAYDAFSSPATVNYGDIEYTVNNKPTGYYGVSYDENIYVGYKYYETRYYDTVTNQGNTLNYNYDKEVQFPFGYGLSYTNFKWSNFKSKVDNDKITLSCSVKNIGNVAGKDVVEAYLNSPYTSFDIKNHIEKSSTSLVGFAKTSLLNPNEEEEISITIDLDDFKTYDDVVNKTYILEAGDYNLTLANNAHQATNNFLSIDNKANKALIIGNYDSSFVYTYTVEKDDITTYSLSKQGVSITNHFDEASYIDRDKYLTRNDWTNSYPKTHGSQNALIKSSYSEKNGYKYYEEISKEQLERLEAKGNAKAANSNILDKDLKSLAGTYNNSSDLKLIDYRGLDFKEADWDTLVSSMTTSEVGQIINNSGYETAKADSISKPKARDLDGPMGLNITYTHETYTISYPSEVTIASTWNKKLSKLHGNAVAMDGLRSNVKASGWYGPAVNIHRTPFSGRNFEYYSEDSFMNGEMAKEAISAAACKGMYSYIKHFALNDQENHRADNGLATFSNEQAIREIYLKPFQKVFEAGNVETKYYKNDNGKYVLTTSYTKIAKAVMTSYNRIGYTWSGGDYRLVTEVLRNEWGFNGIVLTDYSTGADTYMNTRQMLRAGGDLQLTNYNTSYDITSFADVYYTKQAMKHVCYTIANSNAMNGYINTSKFVTDGYPIYNILLITLDVILSGLSTLSIVNIIKEKKKRKQ